MEELECLNNSNCHYIMLVILSFFFQAEDGIRDLYVTGVQTCALPISGSDFMNSPAHRANVLDRRWDRLGAGAGQSGNTKMYRSEERRVGKECRSRWSPDN